MPEQAVVWIDAGIGRVEGGALKIDRAGHNEPVQRFEFPAAFDKLARQPFQQFRMSRRIAPRAEIVDGANESLAEMMLPHSVHDHARQKRAGAVLGVGHPLGHSAPLLSRIGTAALGARRTNNRRAFCLG